jgi:quinol monooxygenase YgiN
MKMSGTPIHAFAKWKVRPGQLENVLLILKELKAKTVQEKGNLFYHVYQDNSDPNTLILYEGYADDSALTQHRNAGYYIQAVAENIRMLLTDREVILTTLIEI